MKRILQAWILSAAVAAGAVAFTAPDAVAQPARAEKKPVRKPVVDLTRQAGARREGQVMPGDPRRPADNASPNPDPSATPQQPDQPDPAREPKQNADQPLVEPAAQTAEPSPIPDRAESAPQPADAPTPAAPQPSSESSAAIPPAPPQPDPAIASSPSAASSASATELVEAVQPVETILPPMRVRVAELTGAPGRAEWRVRTPSLAEAGPSPWSAATHAGDPLIVDAAHAVDVRTGRASGARLIVENAVEVRLGPMSRLTIERAAPNPATTDDSSADAHSPGPGLIVVTLERGQVDVFPSPTPDNAAAWHDTGGVLLRGPGELVQVGASGRRMTHSALVGTRILPFTE